ncbi:MAG: TPM domain-containing protein [Clostridia bacterium]|nr:TPM domain-containing protein [Clostridia bacterium]
MRLRKMLCAITIGALLLAAACMPALAKVVSPGKDFYYLDDANVLSEAFEGEVFFSNQLLNDACGAQIAVVTLDSTGDAAIDDYAYELFNTWGVGDKVKQNGVVLLLAIGDDDYYTVCGTGLQSKLTSGQLKRYYDDYLESDFAAKRYEAGARKFFEAVFEYVADAYNADVTVDDGVAAYEAWLGEGEPGELEAHSGGGSYEGPSNRGRDYESDDDSDAMIGMVVILLVVILIIVIRRRRRRRLGVTGRGTQVVPIIFGSGRPIAPPPPGAGGYRGANAPRPGIGAGGQRGRVTHTGGLFGGSSGGGLFGGSSGSRPSGSGLFGGSSGSRPSGGGLFGGSSSSRPSGGGFFGGSSGSSSRSSSSNRSGFGGSRGGGGSTRGGGAGRGRH